ncbi:MAG: hypothetical protein V1866_04515 [archaeon]
MLNLNNPKVANVIKPEFVSKLSKEKKDDIRSVLEALTTTIETINERLARGAGRDQDSAAAAYMQRLNSSLQYVYQVLTSYKKDQESMKSGISELKASVNKSVTEAAQIFMVETRKMLQSANLIEPDKPATAAQAAKPADKPVRLFGEESSSIKFMLDFEKRLQQVILINTEEVELFRKQNKYLQSRLESIEQKLDAILGKSQKSK